MSEAPGRRFGLRAAAALLAAGAVIGVLTAGTGEDDLVRQLKVDVFDQNWAAVLEICDEILARHPGSPARVQAAFYRTRALARLPGREDEAIEALRRFLRARPDDRLLVEEAWSSLFSLACAPGRSDTGSCREALGMGLADPAPFVSTLAAIRAADSDDRALRRKALPLLKKAYESQIEPDIRNEILIAILKIDPGEIPGPDPPERPTRPGHGNPKFIRMVVFDKTEQRFELKVQFPVAFARMLIDSLGEARKDDLRREARRQGMNIDEIFEAIRESGTGRLLEVDTEDSRIEIWIE